MNILGIALQHDAGACVIKDGIIIAAVNEERLNRKKMYWGIPELSIKEVLNLSNLKPGEIDKVVISNLFTGNPIRGFESTWQDPISRITQYVPQTKWGKWTISTKIGIKLGRFILNYLVRRKKPFEDCKKYLKSLGIEAPVINVDHHTAHASSAYFTSGWDECLAITLDAVGDGYCSKIFIAKNGVLKEIHRIPFFHSPGYYYAYVTHMCHFIPERHEGKITGLAAYGDPKKTIDIFRKEIYYSSPKFSFVNKGGYLWPEIWRLEKLLKGYSQEDLSAGIQLHLEEMVVSYIADALKKTGQTKVALAGGVFANVKLNQRILEIDGIKGIWIHPHMGDGGLGVGAGLHVQNLGALELRDVYFGPSYSNDDVEKILKRENCKYNYFENIEQEIAKKLSVGKVVARFSGRMEYGPRALGNRSILYQATDQTVNDWLNKRLKRTEFMPFAPVLLEEDAKYFLKGYDERSSHAAEFMTITYDVTDRCKKEAPAVVHIDGTARPQIVKPDINPSYEKVLMEYKKLTKFSILINTSYNMHEEPIVCTPYDAVRAFKLGHLDYLAIENFLVEN